MRQGTQTDSWDQAANNEVDILWVIDNSASMAEEQAALAEGAAAFTVALDESGTDYQVGLITTSFDDDDSSRGILVGEPRFLTNDDPVAELFSERAAVGIDGSDREKGLESALFAVDPVLSAPGGANAGFVRQGADLLVVFVSDEEDCSDLGALAGESADACYSQRQALPPVSMFIEDLWDLKGGREFVQVASIVGVEDSTCPDVFPSERYVEAAELAGGLTADICTFDWTTVLADVGLTAAGLQSSFQLSRGAIDGTLRVFVDGNGVAEDVDNGWTYDPLSWYITFHGEGIPPRGSTITADYNVISGQTIPPAELPTL